MDSASNSTGSVVSPLKEKTTNSNRSTFAEGVQYSENLNPNVSSPRLKFSSSPSTKKPETSAKKSAQSPNRNFAASPLMKKKIRERKFVIAKKKIREDQHNISTSSVVCEKCGKGIGKSRCLCLAYERLQASHEEFFKNCGGIQDETGFDQTNESNDEVEISKGSHGIAERNDEDGDDKDESVANLKRSRERLLEEARESAPEPGSGKVKYLVQAFEKLGVKADESEGKKVKDEDKGMQWALPGLQHHKDEETQFSSSFSPSDIFLTSENLGLDPRRSHSLDSNQGRIPMRISADVQQRRRSSTESSGTMARRHQKKKQRKATSQKPFMLRTEERGRCKKEEFIKKLRQMMEEEEKLRIPVAQGLPWTTDEPECLVKPPSKETTMPVDLVLHSDIRAVERAEFDHQVAEKMSLFEQYKMERERQQKLAEEEEIRRLRKELVPKAQPMPYFDRPFIPRRSMKNPTMPKDPKFHLPQHKKIKCYMSSDDLFMNQNTE